MKARHLRNLSVLAATTLAFYPTLRAEQPDLDDPVKIAAASNVADAYQDSSESINHFPIGVFDSGTGGLTILQQILTIDDFDNDSHRNTATGDGKADFSNESFIFLADQANMPYGNYPIVEKEQLLDDLIVKDAEFLMNRRYFRGPDDERPQLGKLPVKAIVIACNTATAYGHSDIQDVVQQAGLDLKVIGVIDAGAKGAIEVLNDGKSATIGVMPTKGTALSGAYPIAIRRTAKSQQLTQPITILQQGAFGLAGSIDGARAFILTSVKTNTARDDYRGPSLTNSEARIDRRILPRYDFDFSENRMLYDGMPDDPSELQLNSVENYIAFHLVTLLEKVRASAGSAPLRAIILGCTHFPFYQDAFAAQLQRLRDYQEDGEYIYRPHMAKNIHLIDPAYYTARALYQSLNADKRFRSGISDDRASPRGEFYITVPCRLRPGVKLQESKNAFTYEYKYGRKAGIIESDYRAVPISASNTSQDVFRRLENRVPAVWELLREFRDSTKETGR
jgi:glutamate racemase